METTTIIKQREMAVKVMRSLNLFEPVIEEFRAYNILYYSEEGNLRKLEKERKLTKAIEDCKEQIGDDLIFHAIHNKRPKEETLFLLTIPADQKDWYMLRDEMLRMGYLETYMIDLQHPELSEIRQIRVRTVCGGLELVE